MTKFRKFLIVSTLSILTLTNIASAEGVIGKEYHLYKTIEAKDVQGKNVVSIDKNKRIKLLKYETYRGYKIMSENQYFWISKQKFEKEVELNKIKVNQKTLASKIDKKRVLGFNDNNTDFSFLNTDKGVDKKENLKKIINEFQLDSKEPEIQLNEVMNYIQSLNMTYGGSEYKQIDGIKKNGKTKCLGYNFLAAKLLDKTDLYYRTVIFYYYKGNNDYTGGHIYLEVSPDNINWYPYDMTDPSDLPNVLWFIDENTKQTQDVYPNYTNENRDYFISPTVYKGKMVEDSYYTELTSYAR